MAKEVTEAERAAAAYLAEAIDKDPDRYQRVDLDEVLTRLIKYDDLYHTVESRYLRLYNELADDEDLEVAVVLFNGQKVLASNFITEGTRWMAVQGIDEEKREVEVVLANESLQVLLTKVKRKADEPPKRPIGFLYLADKTPKLPANP